MVFGVILLNFLRRESFIIDIIIEFGINLQLKLLWYQDSYFMS